MKKIILTISIIVSIVGLLITASPLILRLTGLDKPAKAYLIGLVLKDDQVNADIENFRIGLGTLELNDLNVVSADNRFHLHIPIVQFSFYLHDFFLHPTNPQLALKSVIFIRPHLTMTTDTSKQELPRQADESQKNFSALFRTLNKIHNIRSVELEEGTFTFKRGQDTPLELARNISGQLTAADSGRFYLTVNGCALSKQDTNFSLKTTINLKSRKAVAEFTFLDYQIARAVFPYSFDEIKMDGGSVNGKLWLVTTDLNPDSTYLNGKLVIRDFKMRTRGRQWDKINFTLRVDQKILTISDGNGLVENFPFQFKVKSENWTRGRLDADLTLPNFSTAVLSDNVFDKRIKNLRIQMRASIPDTSLKLKLFADRVGLFSTGNLDSVSVEMNYRNGQLEIPLVSAQYEKQTRLFGNAVWNLPDDRLRVRFGINGYSGTHILLDKFSGKVQTGSLTAGLNTKTGELKGKWEFGLTDQIDTTAWFSGDIRGTTKEVRVKLTRCTDPFVRARLRMQNLFTNPVIREATLINFPWDTFSSEPLVVNSFKNLQTEIRLQGPFEDLSAKITVAEKKSKENIFHLNARIQNLFGERKRINGIVELKKMLGFYSATFQDAHFAAKVKFPAGISGQLNLDLNGEGPLNGKVQLTDFNIFSALSDTLLANDLRLKSRLSGKLDLSGTLKNPKLEAHLSGDRFIFNNIGYYRSDMALRLDREVLNVDSLVVSLNNLPVMEGNLQVRFTDERLLGNIAGTQVDVYNVLQSVDSSLNALSGTANYAMSLGGTYNKPKIAASGSVINGSFGNIGFTSLDFHLTDTLALNGKFYNPQDHRIIFSDLSVQSDGEYRLQANGNFPLKADVPLDMNVHFSGDVLAFLPKLVPFFEGGTSLSDIRLNLGGTRSQLVVKSGMCQIERGELWLKSVAPHIENIHGLIELKEGTNQVNIRNLKATADGREVTFNTVRNITTNAGRKLKPWYFNTFNLDFGILAIRTAPNGVKLNLPGLMKKEDEGYFTFGGKSKNEPFYFAGPIKHPVAYGKITVQNARVTYPFIEPETVSRKPSVAVEFLSNLDWDVLVKAGEATIYEREIPAYIDNVNTELYADVSSPGLAFSGIINNGTFHALGKLTSSRGRLEYLDQNFKLDIFTIEFTQWDEYPLISGRAWTTIRDSVGAVPKTIYLKLYAVDQETNSEKQQGSLENFRFKLESADPQIGEDQEQVLSYMGFSVSNLKEKATSVGGSLTERILIRPLLRPIERALENTLGLDMVRINSKIARNLFYSSLGYGSDQNLFFNPFITNSSYLFLMQSSEITVGKYLSKDLYLTYTGQLVSVYNQTTPELDMNHSIGLEYRFFRNVLLEFEYDRELMRYYRFSSQKQYLNDFKIRLRHSFTF